MSASKLILSEYISKLVPEPLQYAVLLPEGYGETTETLPFLYFFHGGGENRDFLEQRRPLFESLWRKGTLPPLIAVTPSAGGSQYMDYRDGSQRWEQLLTGPFLTFLRGEYRIRRDPQGTVVCGISMGGLGALRMGFKYPTTFGGIAALEPGVVPSLSWEIEIQQRNLYWRSDEMEEAIYGAPIDKDYWRANNPASIAIENVERIRASRQSIYLDCGNQDALLLFEGAEFLHRVLWDYHIPHEYHLVHGADHVGSTLEARSREGLEFLGRMIAPVEEDSEAMAFRKQMRQQYWGGDSDEV